jgi:PAS domain S-box-containing protein
MDGLVDIRRIFDCVSEIWILLDRNGRVLLSSKHLGKFQQMINPPLAEGSSLIDSIPDSWKALAANVLSTLPTSRVPSILEASFTEADQKEIHFEIKCTGIPDTNGDLMQIFVEARDVTPQKIFERKITIVAREYQSLIENANAVIIGTDARGYVTEWNEMAHQVTGYSRNECYLRQFSEFLVEESQAGYKEAIDRVLDNQVITNYEMTLRAKHGERLTLLINATPRTSASGEVVGILFIGQDITELWTYRKSLEAKVKERTQALKSALESEKKLVEVKDRFVSMASHEFRSPISYIHRNIGALRDNIESLSIDDVRQRLKKIQSQAEHLTSLLEDVLTMGKTGASNTRIKANLRHVDLKEFFHRVIDEVQTNTQNTHRIRFSCSYDSLTILSDENLLRNIFVNLLTNAIKFSPGRDAVDLIVADFGRYVQCNIQDYGLGIGEQDLPRIFEPFHRGENVSAIKGTGLGLPIVKKAVETLGGAVEVDSKAGQGSLFIVKLNQHHS